MNAPCEQVYLALELPPLPPKTEIWVAISVYLLLAIIKKRLGLRSDFYGIHQLISLTIFENNTAFTGVQISQAIGSHGVMKAPRNRLNLLH